MVTWNELLNLGIFLVAFATLIYTVSNSRHK